MNIHLKPLDEIIKKDFFLPIFMESIVSDERNVYWLTIRDKGLEIPIHYESSKTVTPRVAITPRVAVTPRVAIKINQGNVLPDKNLATEIKSIIIKQNESALL